ncbi:MAG: hypothetical protein ABIP35_09115 [Ginsengibacter sp.]
MKMKKMTSLVLATLCLFAVACNSNSSNDDANLETAPVSIETTKQAAPNVGDSLQRNASENDSIIKSNAEKKAKEIKEHGHSHDQ